jgi:beta-lactamase class A
MGLDRRQFLALLSCASCAAAMRKVEDRWRQIAGESDGTVGAAVLHLRTGQTASLNGTVRFPLASVCKLPIAIHIFSLIDEGKLTLDQLIEIPLYDVVLNISPVAERWPGQKSFPLRELVDLMVARSDNTAVQTLFRLGGGEAGMAERLRRWQVTGVRIDRSERQCGLDAVGVRDIPPVSDWTPRMDEDLIARIAPAERLAAFRRFLADPRDTGTPDGTIQILKKLFATELLSKALTSRLEKTLENTTTGPDRLKGKLPPLTVVAHKTGTTATVMGLNGATNDVGVVTLPNGKDRFAIAVYVKARTGDAAARDAVIAKFARAAFDFLA